MAAMRTFNRGWTPPLRLTTGPEVRTQRELDEALLQGLAPRCVGDGAFTVGGHATVSALDTVRINAFDYATINASGTARVDATHGATVWAHDHASVIGREEAMVIADDDATAMLLGSALGQTYDRAQIESWGGSAVRAHDLSLVSAFGHSKVTALDDARVVAHGDAQVVATDHAVITACERAQIRACGGNPRVVSQSDQATCSLGGPLEIGEDGAAIRLRLQEPEKSWTVEVGGITIFGASPEQASLLKRREAFVNGFLAERGWDAHHLSMEQLLEVRKQPDWQSPPPLPASSPPRRPAVRRDEIEGGLGR
jgi:hypothetical protein